MEIIQTLKYALSFIAIFTGFVIAVFWLYCAILAKKKEPVAGHSSPAASGRK